VGRVKGIAVPSDLRMLEPEDHDSVLPPGRRDASGFWFPLHCKDPRTLLRRRSRSVKKTRRVMEHRRAENGVA
jgi:hypothetical protein